ncbi:MAG TPA: hypothetical protein VL527_13470, partial [Dongiaceae bacterium]|nr:hypothetical protein [Dongiaceae bacterium]
MKKFLPWIIVGAFTAWILVSLRPPQDQPGQMNLQEFGALPVISSGRFQPIDTLARNTLLQLRDKSSANLEPWSSHPQIISATAWLLATAITPDVADNYPVFRVDHPELISLLKLPEKNLEQHSDGKSYSWNQIKPELEILRREADRSSGIESAHRTTYDQAVVRLWNAHQLYEQVQGMFGPAASGELTQSVNHYLDQVDLGRSAYQQMQANKPYDAAALEWLSAQFGAPVILPGRTEDDWKRVAEYYVNSDASVVPNFALTAYARIAAAYRTGNVADFNQAVAE